MCVCLHKCMYVYKIYIYTHVLVNNMMLYMALLNIGDGPQLLWQFNIGKRLDQRHPPLDGGLLFESTMIGHIESSCPGVELHQQQKTG